MRTRTLAGTAVLAALAASVAGASAAPNTYAYTGGV